jgi:hypothetical protein
MVTVDYFLFTWMKIELLVISVTQESSKKNWDGVARTIAKEDFTMAFGRWQERYKKCDRIGNVNV